MHVELSLSFTSFGVHLVLEIAEELFEGIDVGPQVDIVNVQSGFEDGALVRLFLGRLFDLSDALFDQARNLSDHNLGHFSAFFPEHISSSFGSCLAVSTHI